MNSILASVLIAHNITRLIINRMCTKSTYTNYKLQDAKIEGEMSIQFKKNYQLAPNSTFAFIAKICQWHCFANSSIETNRRLSYYIFSLIQQVLTSL